MAYLQKKYVPENLMKNIFNIIRLFDIFLAFVALVILIPILLPVVIVLRFTGEKEVFYLQTRIGKNSKSFKLYKFATMLKNSESMGAGMITVMGDPRVLPFGKFLRKTKINELPQLFNILKGDMSFVGPRPLPSKQFNFYKMEDQIIISTVKPGLTGVGSLAFRDEESFFKNPGDSDQIYKEKISPLKAEFEIWYVSNKSFILNMKIIICTFLAVLLPSKNFIGFIDDELKYKYEKLMRSNR